MRANKISKNIIKKISAILISFSISLSFTIPAYANERNDNLENPITCILTENQNDYREFMKNNNGIKGLINGEWALIDLVKSFLN